MAEALTERLDRTIDLVLARRDATAALADAELAPLAVLANELRSCPSAAFKARLRANLERSSVMSTTLEAVEVREGFTTVTPYLQVREEGLLDFLAKVFGAVETSSAKSPRGRKTRCTSASTAASSRVCSSTQTETAWSKAPAASGRLSPAAPRKRPSRSTQRFAMASAPSDGSTPTGSRPRLASVPTNAPFPLPTSTIRWPGESSR